MSLVPHDPASARALLGVLCHSGISILIAAASSRKVSLNMGALSASLFGREQATVCFFNLRSLVLILPEVLVEP